MDWVYLGELVLGTVPRALSGPSCVLGGLRPASSTSLYFPFIIVSFLLDGVPKVGTCPIRPSLQLLGVVVRTGKYGHVRHKIMNAIMAAFGPRSAVVLFPLRGMIGSVTTGGRWPPPSSATLCRGGLSSWLRKGFSSPRLSRDFSLGLGLWPNIVIDMGLLVFYPLQ